MFESGTPRAIRGLLMGCAALIVMGSVPALADGYGHGPKVEVHDNGKDYKYEYKDRHCKYEYQLNYRTGEEKVEQKGQCHGVAPHRAVYYSEDSPRRYEPDAGPYDDEPPYGSRRALSCNRELIGQVLGGIVGGVAGAQVGGGSGRRAATIAGTIAGVLIGGRIGRRMDRSDSACAYQAFEFAEDDQTVFWRNSASELEYRITPQRAVRRANGRYCRDYRASVVGSGLAERSTEGVACRRSDGSWEIAER